jgi:hypothetical protein
MISGKNIPSHSKIEGIKVVSSVEMASEEGMPSAFEIEDVSVTSSTEVTALPIYISSSTTSVESKSPDHDSPPDGGLFAWLQVLGGWILVLNSR